MSADLLTITEIERMYGYARGSLTSVRAKGGMPKPTKQFGRTPLWRAAVIDEWVTKRRSK